METCQADETRLKISIKARNLSGVFSSFMDTVQAFPACSCTLFHEKGLKEATIHREIQGEPTSGVMSISGHLKKVIDAGYLRNRHRHDVKMMGHGVCLQKGCCRDAPPY